MVSAAKLQPGPGYFTDTNLSAVLAAELRDRYRWVPGVGWLHWDGRRWASTDDDKVAGAAREWMARQLADSVRGRYDPDEAKHWLNTARNAGKLHALVRLCKGIDGIRAEVADLDADPDLLNTPSGVVDLRTGELRPHDRNLMMTKVTAAGYDPAATHPDWERALEAVPADCRAYLQVRLGQAVTGHTPPDDVLLVVQGGGENGKTATLGAVTAALGDYFALISDRVLLAHPGDHPTEMTDLRGVRFALIEETPEARRLAPARLKKVVGTPRITARRIRQDNITFTATHSLVVTTNYLPIVDEVDHGTWRRLLLLRFPYRFRKTHEQLEQPLDRRGDQGLRERLLHKDCAAGPAVLRWLVDGAVAWHQLARTMPAPPQRVLDDVLAWRQQADPVLSYVADRLVFDPDRHVMSAELLEDFNAWLRDHSRPAWSDKTFFARFADHESTAGRVQRRKVRFDAEKLSRSIAPGVPQRVAGATFWAWSGVRFRTVADDQEDRYTPRIRWAVPPVPDPNDDALRKPSYGRNQFDPEQREQALPQAVPQ